MSDDFGINGNATLRTVKADSDKKPDLKTYEGEVYLATFSAVIGSLISNEFKRIWKETVVA
jgi:hypothetical protein